MMPLRKILVPTDFSESARRALDYGLAFARDYQAELILLHVVEAVPVGYASDLFPVPVAEMYQEVSAYARAELAKLAAEAAGQGVTTRERVLQGKPSAEIVRLAAEEAVDLIVLGTHGKDLLDQAIFGSTTERVVRKAPCPVLTCHALERGAKPAKS
ncbi:MAG TPA: universal stress protein [Vicinamibacteria bacterium]|jgi:nucleotide-binding universal stress UspA family protein